MPKAQRPSHPWSLTGAARAAREARVASARFLATPAMAEWHESELQRTLVLYQAFDGGDGRIGLFRLLGNLGYLPPYPDRDHLSEVILRDEARYLRGADLYVLSPQMADVVLAAALALTEQDLLLMRAEHMPTLTGLVVLPHPLLVRAMSGELTDPRAFLWSHPARIVMDSGVAHARHTRTVPAVHLSIYDDGHGPVRPRQWRDFTAEAAAAGTPVPPLFLDGKRGFPLGQAITPRMRAQHSRFYQVMRRLGTMSHDRLIQLGLNDDQVVGEYTPGQEIDDPHDLICVKFLFAFWRLAQQRIAVAEYAPVPHSALVAAGRAGVPADVRVMQLRRADERHAAERQRGQRERLTGSIGGQSGCTRYASGTPRSAFTTSSGAAPTSRGRQISR